MSDMNKCDLEEAKHVALERFKELAKKPEEWSPPRDSIKSSKMSSEGHYWSADPERRTSNLDNFQIVRDTKEKEVTLWVGGYPIKKSRLSKSKPSVLEKFFNRLEEIAAERKAADTCRQILKALEKPEPKEEPPKGTDGQTLVLTGSVVRPWKDTRSWWQRFWNFR